MARLAAAALSLSLAAAAPAADRVTNLPGWGAPQTATYSGYLDIPGGKHIHCAAGVCTSRARPRRLTPPFTRFADLFVASQGASATDPVVYWSNGVRRESPPLSPRASARSTLIERRCGSPYTLRSTSPAPLASSPQGPGCSSLEGAFAESGPLWTVAGGKGLQKNDYTWNAFSNNLFFEAPAGVGFSYADTRAGTEHNDTGTAADSLAALNVWRSLFPEYAANPLWLTGESYAGV
jgi:hypothetical protein